MEFYVPYSRRASLLLQPINSPRLGPSEEQQLKVCLKVLYEAFSVFQNGEEAEKGLV